jgi:gas vesicle protein
MSKSQDNSLQNFLVGLLVGALTGALLSLLYSPNSGSENRRLAKKWVDDTSSDLKEGVEHLKEEVENPYSKARQYLDEKRYSLEKRWNKWQATQDAKKINEAKSREDLAWHDDDLDTEEVVQPPQAVETIESSLQT